MSPSDHGTSDNLGKCDHVSGLVTSICASPFPGLRLKRVKIARSCTILFKLNKSFVQLLHEGDIRLNRVSSEIRVGSLIEINQRNLVNLNSDEFDQIRKFVHTSPDVRPIRSNRFFFHVWRLSKYFVVQERERERGTRTKEQQDKFFELNCSASNCHNQEPPLLRVHN